MLFLKAKDEHMPITRRAFPPAGSRRHPAARFRAKFLRGQELRNEAISRPNPNKIKLLAPSPANPSAPGSPPAHKRMQRIEGQWEELPNEPISDR